MRESSFVFLGKVGSSFPQKPSVQFALILRDRGRLFHNDNELDLRKDLAMTLKDFFRNLELLGNFPLGAFAGEEPSQLPTITWQFGASVYNAWHLRLILTRRNNSTFC